MSNNYSRWTREDKIKLLHGLKQYGYRDMKSINKLIPHKSYGAIRTMIYRYSMLAKNALKDENPLEEWLHHSVLREESSMIPEALLYISLYEDQPPPEETDGINIRALYESFYRASANLSIPDLSEKDIETLNNLHQVVCLKSNPTTQSEVLEYLNAINEKSTKVSYKTYSRKQK